MPLLTHRGLEPSETIKSKLNFLLQVALVVAFIMVTEK